MADYGQPDWVKTQNDAAPTVSDANVGAGITAPDAAKSKYVPVVEL